MARRKWRAAAAMAAAIAFNFAGAAHADIVPGEEIERPDGMLETVVKFDAGKEKVCMRPYAAKECVWRKVTEVKRWIAAHRAAVRAAEEAEACKGYTAKRSIAIVNGVTVFEGKATVQYCPEGNETTIRKGTHTVEIANDEYGENRGTWINEKTGTRIKVGPMRAKGACWLNDKAKVCAWK